ncbi:MAG: metallophosphoesterase [Acidobacteriota bacterium]|nr:metallophosphoesterase [Acidobacteriota bacterium]
MRSVAHISDLHFGREDPVVVRGLLDAVASAEPSLIAISGDLTQRARVSQFKQAREFLDALPRGPLIVVPGNHDISATNLLLRLARPLSRYSRYISADFEPFFEDPEIAIVGVNTVRILNSKDGRINLRQIVSSCNRFHALQSGPVRIVVMHHPIDLPAEDNTNALVGRAALAVSEFAGCKVDLFLSGHLHAAQTISTSARYNIEGYSAIVAQAGTAVSTRTRGQVNSWNLITIDGASITVQQMVWEAQTGAFIPATVEQYRKSDSGWALVPTSREPEKSVLPGAQSSPLL